MSHYFDGVAYTLHNAGRQWSYKETDTGPDEIRRFEVRPGDVWRSADGTKERSEISSGQKLQFNKTYVLTYGLMIEEGEKSTQDNVKIGQLHGTPDATDSNNLGPIFALQLKGERLRIVVRSDAAASSPDRVEDNFIYTDNADLVRGHWYDMKIIFRLDPQGHGHLEVWRDGIKLVAYDGGLGYNDAVGPYWKEGIYRAAGQVTMAVDFKNTMLVAVGAEPTVPTPAPTPPPPTTPTPVTPPPPPTPDPVVKLPDHSYVGGVGPDKIIGDGHNNTIYADGLGGLFGANDFVDAGKGVDIVYGGMGNDTLLGGEGDDRLLGEVGDDILIGGAGNDKLTGGAGSDLFVFLNKSGRDVITDFDPRADRLQFEQSIFADFADLMARATDGSEGVTIKNTSGNTILFAGMKKTDFDANRITFSKAMSSAETTGGAVVISAASDDDEINGGYGGDSIGGGQGHDVLSGGYGTDAIYGNQGNDTLYGNQDNDYLHGGQGDDIIYGGQGGDTINGGVGDDVLSGNLGDDLFVFDPGFGRDTVADFNPGDRILFNAGAFGDFADLKNHASQTASGLLLTASAGESVLIVGAVLETLNPGQFLFG